MSPDQRNIVPPQPQQDPSSYSQYDYVTTETRIGAGKLGIRPLAQHGTILINDGQLWLLGSQDQVIAQGPLRLCTVTKGPWFTFGQVAWLTIQGTRYSVAIGDSKSFGRIVHKGATLNRQGTPTFIEAFHKLTHTA